MPAKSKAQRRAAGMAAAIQKGEMDPRPGMPSEQMSMMLPGDLREFAQTEEAELPQRVRPMGAKKQRKPGGRRFSAKKGRRRSG